jgi:hypothetical protein
MITDEQLDAKLQTLSSARGHAADVGDVVRSGRKRIHRRRATGAVGALAAVAALVSVIVTSAREPDTGVVADSREAAQRIDEAAASRGFGQNRLLSGLTVGPDGALWAAWEGQGIYKFGNDMQVEHAIEDVDPNVYSSGIAVADDGTIIAFGWSVTEERDASDGTLFAKTLSRIGDDGRVTPFYLDAPQEPVTGSNPPQIDRGRVYIQVGRRIVSVTLDHWGITRSPELDDYVRNFNVADGRVWVATGRSVYELGGGTLDVKESDASAGANEALAAAGVPWVLNEGGDEPAKRLDGKATTEEGDWGNPLDIDTGGDVLWVHSHDALSAHNPATGKLLATRPGQVFGALIAAGATAWVQDDLAGGVIRRYELVQASDEGRTHPTTTNPREQAWVPPVVARSDPDLPLVGPRAWREQLPFYYTESDNRRMYTAWQHRIAACMTEAGFDYTPVEYVPTDGLDFISPLDRAAATALGYHWPSDGVRPERGDGSSAFYEASADCANSAMAETFGAVAAFSTAVDGALAQFDAAVNGWAATVTGKTKTREWAACMSDRGYLYTDPDQPRAEFGEGQTLSEREVETRLADLDCDVSVGMTAARSAYEEAAAQEWIATHARLVNDLVEQKRTYDALLDSLEPEGRRP